MVDGHIAVHALLVCANYVVRLAAHQLAVRAYAYAFVVAERVQPAVEGRLQLGKKPLQDAGGLHESAVGTARGAIRGGVLVGLGKQSDQRLVRELEDLLQGADGAQRLGALRATGALLPVTQAGHPDLDPVPRQVVLYPLQGQPAGGDRGAQRDMEGAAPQSRLQFRRGEVRVLCAVPHAGAFL